MAINKILKLCVICTLSFQATHGTKTIENLSEKLKTLSTQLTQLKIALSQLTDSLDDNFAEIKEHFTNTIHEIGAYHYKPDKNNYLSMCSCPNMLIASRLKLIKEQLAKFSQRFPDPSKPYVHVALGGGGLLQSFMLAYGLKKYGYENLTIYSIDPILEGVHGDVTTKDIIATFKQFLPHVNVQVFESDYEYLQAVKQHKALKAHSFDLVDAGSAETAGVFLSKTKPADYPNYNKITIYSSAGDEFFSSPIAHFYLRTNGEVTCRVTKVNIRTDEQHNHLKTLFDTIRQESYTTISKLIEKIKGLKNKLAQNLKFKNYNLPKINDEWQNSELFLILSNTAPLAFENIIQHAKAVQNPLIFLGEKNKVYSFEKKYKPDIDFYFGGHHTAERSDTSTHQK